MASSSQPNSTPKASWDDTNTGILLQLLVEEIDAGNRPSGHFTKTAWANIGSKFIMSSGCNFSITQLKNKWDNMKKEFTLWEKLLHEETGLGYDHSTSRIVADPIWWRNKLQEKPEFRRFKTHGPIHLELQEKVFRGVVATGYMEYYPGEDVFLGEGVRNDGATGGDAHDMQQPEAVEHTDSSDNVPPPLGVENNVGSRGGRVPTKKRTRSTATNATVGEVNRTMVDMINVIRDESASSIRHAGLQADEYGKAIQMLCSLPWMDMRSEQFATLVILLEDPTKRVAFSNLVDLGEEVITNWVAAWKNRF